MGETLSRPPLHTVDVRRFAFLNVTWPLFHHIRLWSLLRAASWLLMRGSSSTEWLGDPFVTIFVHCQPSSSASWLMVNYLWWSTFFFFITLEHKVEWHTSLMSFTYEPSSVNLLQVTHPASVAASGQNETGIDISLRVPHLALCSDCHVLGDVIVFGVFLRVFGVWVSCLFGGLVFGFPRGWGFDPWSRDQPSTNPGRDLQNQHLRKDQCQPFVGTPLTHKTSPPTPNAEGNICLPRT